MSDPRSLDSELHAFSYLKLDPNDREQLAASERDLIDSYGSHGLPVPEAIFKVANKRVTVEVKRIPGNTLPLENGSQRKLTRRGFYVWPWKSTVFNAMKKATPRLSLEYGIVIHHVVFVVPDNLTRKTRCRLQNHILSAVNEFRHDENVHPKIQVHIIDAPVEMFDRLCS